MQIPDPDCCLQEGRAWMKCGGVAPGAEIHLCYKIRRKGCLGAQGPGG